MRKQWWSRGVLRALCSVAMLAAIPASGTEPYWCVDEATCACDPCQPKAYPRPERSPWYFQSEGLALHRDVRGATPIASLGPGPAPVGINTTTELDEPFSAGARFLVGHTFGESPFQVEFSGFSLAEWQSEAAVRDPDIVGNNLYSPFTDFGFPTASPLVDQFNLVTISETSSLENGELNLRRMLPMPPGRLTASWLIGARYIRIRERFDYASFLAGGAPLATVSTRTGNELWGPQIGGLAQFYIEDCWWIDFEIKGAIFNNAAFQETTFDSTGLAGPVTLGRDRSVTSYLGDLKLTLVYRWCPSLTTRIGYQAMWIDGLAQASRNFAAPLGTLQVGPAVLDHRGQSVYHGVHAGVELNW